MFQVYPDGIRHIRADKRVNEWKAPGKKTIVKCAVNQRQVVIALTGGELVYFEMDPVKIASIIVIKKKYRIIVLLGLFYYDRPREVENAKSISLNYYILSQK